MIDGIEIFALTGQRMNHLATRASVIARNIANADTPGYRAQDVKPFQVNSPLFNSARGANGAAPELRLAATAPGHASSRGAAAMTTIDRTASSYGEKPNGNNVSIEEQMVRNADTAKEYEMATTIYRRMSGLMRAATGGQR